MDLIKLRRLQNKLPAKILICFMIISLLLPTPGLGLSTLSYANESGYSGNDSSISGDSNSSDNSIDSSIGSDINSGDSSSSSSSDSSDNSDNSDSSSGDTGDTGDGVVEDGNVEDKDNVEEELVEDKDIVEDKELAEEEAIDGNYSVTYYKNSDGVTGNVPVDEKTYALNESVTVLDSNGLNLFVTHENVEYGGMFNVIYAFTGWNTEPDGCGIAYQPGESFPITGNVDLYAMWEEEKIVEPFQFPNIPVTMLLRNFMVPYADGDVPGALVIDKRAVPSSGTDESQNIWEWDVTLSLRGLDLITSSDVVLVIDTSGSMLFDNKMANTQAAARAFVNQLLKGDGKTRIALVSFAEGVTTSSSFSTDATALHSAINGLNANGGTYLQAGIRKAHELLKNSSANNKYIVLLGDGQPTYSAKITSITGVTISSYTGNGTGSIVWNTVPLDQRTYTFDYSSRTGNGISYTASISGVPVQCTNSTHGTHDFPIDNHGIPTIYQAKLAKDDGIELYSVAANADTNGQYVLGECAGGSSFYYSINSTDTSGLTGIFTEIAGKIAYAASNAVVTDTIGEGFQLVSDPNNINVSAGTATYNPGTGVITWNIGDIKQADGTFTITYTLRIDVYNTDPETMYDTNGPTWVDYNDVNSVSVDKDFLSPQVGYPQVGSITKYIYILDDQGRPLNIQGQPAQSRDEIAFHAIEHFYNPSDPTSTALPYGTYTVTADPYVVVNGDYYAFAQGNATNRGDVSPVDVPVNVYNQSQRVYFAYEIPKGSFHVTYSGEGATAGAPPVDSNAYAYHDEVTVLGKGTLERDEYEFKGWSVTPNGDGTYKPGDTFNIYEDTTLYAVWLRKITVEVIANNLTVPYDGTEKSVEGFAPPIWYDGNVAGAELRGINVPRVSRTVPGANDVLFDGTPVVTVNGVDVTENYDVRLVPGKLIVTPRGVGAKIQVTVTANSGLYYVYDGVTEYTVAGYTVAGLDKNEELFGVDDPTASRLLVGETIVEFNAESKANARIMLDGEDLSENYEITFVNGLLKVNMPEVSKSSHVNIVKIGDAIVYTITAGIPAAYDTWKNATLVDVLPTTVDYVGYTGDATVVNDNGTLTIEFGDVAGGESKSVEFTVVVNETAVPGEEILNSVTLGEQEIEDPAPPVVEDTSLEVVKTAAIDGVAYEDGMSTQVGSVITYTIIVTNTGNVTQSGVHVVDVMLGIDTYIDLAIGASQSFTGTHTVVEEDGTSVYNIATANGESSEIEIPVDKVSTINVEKTAAIDGTPYVVGMTAQVGSVITYTITVKNTGNVAQSRVHVVDVMLGIDEYIDLVIGESRSFSGTHVVEVADGTSIYNVATANEEPGEIIIPVEEQRYTVTFNSNGGTAVESLTNVPHGSLINAPTTTRSGYTFVSWNKPDGSAWNFETDRVTSDITLTASWTGGGSGGGGGGGSGSSGGSSGGGETVVIEDEPTPLAFYSAHILYIYGYPEGDVRPDTGITRAEAAAIFHRLLANTDKNDYVAASFTDLGGDEWHYQSIAYLEKYSIVNGYPDGTFRPDATITRAEYATIASRFDKLTYTSRNAFSDVTSNHWAVSYINSAAAKGWVNGFEDGTFRPEESITRAQVVTIVNRMLNRVIALAGIPADAPQYTDLTSSHWAYCAIIEASDAHEYRWNESFTEIWNRHGLDSSELIRSTEAANNTDSTESADYTEQ